MEPNDMYNNSSCGTGWNQYPDHSLGHSSGHSSGHQRMNQSFSGSAPSVNHMNQYTGGQGMDQSFSGQSHGNEDESASRGNVSNLMNQSLPVNSIAPIVPMSNSSRSQWTSQTSGLNNNPSSSFMPMGSMVNPMMTINPMTSGPWTSTTGLNSSGVNPGFGVGMNPGLGMGMNPGIGVGMNPGIGVGMNGSHNPSIGSFAANAALQNWLIQYNQWWHYVENRRREAIRMATPASERPRLTPHRYPHRHSRSSFGAKNQLIITFGTSVYIQAIDPSLIDFGESVQVTTWPGPLRYDGERVRKDDVLEYIRLREACLKQESVDMIKDTDTVVSQIADGPCLFDQSLPYDSPIRMNHEKKQMWLLLSMLVKQNGTISGPDISEFLLSHNESDFMADDEGSDIAQYRRYLMLGQRKTALEFATKNGLWGHAFALTFFNNCIKNLTATAPSSGQGQVVSTVAPIIKPDDPMVLMVSKFMNTTIDRDDPLSILYRSFLSQIYQPSLLPSAGNPPPSGASNSNNNSNKLIKTDNLKQFSILLANDCELGNQVAPRASELLKLIITLRNHLTQSLINISRLDANVNNLNSYGSQEEGVRYTDEVVFINEILEYGREDKEFIEALVPYKVRLLTRLFDFGHVTSATGYGYQLRQYYKHYHEYFPGKHNSHLDWSSILSIVWDIESKLYGFDVTNGLLLKPPIHPIITPDSDNLTDPHPSPTHLISDKLSSITLPTVPEDTRSSDPHHDTRHGQDTVDSDPRHRHHDARHGQDTGYRQDLRRESSEVSDSRSASPQKAPIARTSSLSSSAPYHQGNRVRTLSREDSAEQRTSSPTTPSPGHHHPAIPSFPAIPQASIPPLPSSSHSNFFVPPPPTDEPPTVDDFLSHPVQHQPQEQEQEHHQQGHHQPGHGDNAGDDGDHVDRRESYGSGGGSFSQPVFESTVAPGYHGGLMGENRDTIGSPGMSAFSPINSPTMGVNELAKQRSFSQGSANGRMGGQSNDSSGEKESEVDKRKGNRSGWFGSVIAKVIPQGPVRAKLPDDSDKSIYYDDQLKRWVDKNNPDDGALMDAIAKGPPKIPMASAPGQLPLAGRLNPLTSTESSAHQPLSRSAIGHSMPTLPLLAKPTAQLPTAAQLPNLPASGLNGSTNEFSFVRKSNLRPKYVDAWQQQQRKND